MTISEYDFVGEENIFQSMAKAEYILKSIFSNIFTFDDSAIFTIEENIRLSYFSTQEKPCEEGQQVITNEFFDWWFENMPYFYLMLIRDEKTVSNLYNAIKDCVEKEKNGKEFTVLYINFKNFDMDSCKKLEDKLFSSMKRLDCIRKTIDYCVNHMTPTHRFQVSYIVCNFLFLLTHLINSNPFYQYVNACCAFWKTYADADMAFEEPLTEDPNEVY